MSRRSPSSYSIPLPPQPYYQTPLAPTLTSFIPSLDSQADFVTGYRQAEVEYGGSLRADLEWRVGGGGDRRRREREVERLVEELGICWDSDLQPVKRFRLSDPRNLMLLNVGYLSALLRGSWLPFSCLEDLERRRKVLRSANEDRQQRIKGGEQGARRVIDFAAFFHPRRPSAPSPSPRPPSQPREPLWSLLPLPTSPGYTHPLAYLSVNHRTSPTVSSSGIYRLSPSPGLELLNAETGERLPPFTAPGSRAGEGRRRRRGEELNPLLAVLAAGAVLRWRGEEQGGVGWGRQVRALVRSMEEEIFWRPRAKGQEEVGGA